MFALYLSANFVVFFKCLISISLQLCDIEKYKQQMGYFLVLQRISEFGVLLFLHTKTDIVVSNIVMNTLA